MECGEEVAHIRREEQITALMDSYQKLVFSICYKMTADYFAAEDLAQETFLSAYEHLQNFDGANEKAWICRIATNKCLDYMAHSGRKSIPYEAADLESQLGSQETKSPEQTVMEREVREMLLECCRQLKPPYNEVAKSYYYDEMSVNEIAKMRGAGIKTVRTQIYRARNMLRKIYRKENSA